MGKTSLILFIICTFLSASSSAAIFGHKDDRVDTKDAPQYLQNLATSVAALTLKTNIKKMSADTYEVRGRPLKDFDICSDEVFAHETSIANCSGSLVGEDLVLTAAHCLGEEPYRCQDYSILFDYTSANLTINSPLSLKENQVYHCKEILYHAFDLRIAGIDLAIIRLDRKVEGRVPVELDFSFDFKAAIKAREEISLIGYPLGISQKVVTDGQIVSWDQKNVSFRHNLDSFSVNSGGPIFSSEGKQIGVLVRGTGQNLSLDKKDSCQRWGQELNKGFAEGNDLSILRGFFPQ